MANDVKITIHVDDSDAAKLQRLQRQLDQLKNSQGAGSGFDSLAAGAGKAHVALGEASGSAHELGESVHVLHALLRSTGVEVEGVTGRFGILAAARGGIVALAAAIGGSLLAELAKVGAEAERVEKRIKGVFGAAAPKAKEQAV